MFFNVTPSIWEDDISKLIGIQGIPWFGYAKIVPSAFSHITVACSWDIEFMRSPFFFLLPFLGGPELLMGVLPIPEKYIILGVNVVADRPISADGIFGMLSKDSKRGRNTTLFPRERPISILLALYQIKFI